MKKEQLEAALKLVEGRAVDHLNQPIPRVSWRKAAKALGVPRSTLSDALRAHYKGIEGQGGTTPAGSFANAQQKAPRVLLLDLETSPTLAYVWGRFKQYVSQEQVLSESFILSYAYKWLGDETIGFDMGTKKEIREENDKRLVDGLWKLLEKADIVVAHNLLGFDDRVTKTRMLYWGFKPPLTYRKVDTLQIAKSQFRLPSNKLDSIAQYLGLGQKHSHDGFVLWKNVLNGDDEARATMQTYNIQDVALLQDVYLKLRAWDNKAPNMAQLYADAKVRCPCCGSEHLRKTRKKVYTPVSQFDELECLDCGKKSRTRKSTFSREKQNSILANVTT